MLYTKLALMAVFWSGVFPAVNIVLKSMGVFSSVFLRFSAAALILLALLWLREGRLRRLSPRESVLPNRGHTPIGCWSTRTSAGVRSSGRPTIPVSHRTLSLADPGRP